MLQCNFCLGTFFSQMIQVLIGGKGRCQNCKAKGSGPSGDHFVLADFKAMPAQ